MKQILQQPTSACATSTFASTLDHITLQITDAANEHGFSEVLMLTVVKQWCDQQLHSHL